MTTLGIYDFTLGQASDAAAAYGTLSSVTKASEFRHFVTATQIVHSGGEHCPFVMRVGGVQRSMVVDVICGTSNQIVSVVENGMCMYEMVFQTPFGCREAEAKVLRKVSESSQRDA